MKVAFLLTAYHQPAHLARLVKALSCPWAWFFVHVDLKKDISPFVAMLPADVRVTYLRHDQREVCNWGGFGVVQATLNLINAAVKTGEGFDRYCLLSGSDYPIKASEEIYESFSSSREFLDVERRLLDGSRATELDSRVAFYHF